MGRARLALGLLGVALATSAWGQGAPPREIAREVLAAIRAGDDATLKRLASRSDSDPWFVADELCRQGAHDAAARFAKAAPRKDTERLPVYVAWRRDRADDGATRAALAKAVAAVGAKRWAEVLATLEEVKPEDDFLSSRVRWYRGVALGNLRRLDAACREFLAAADEAQRIGWISGAVAELNQCALCAYHGGDLRATLTHWKRALSLQEARGERRGMMLRLSNIGVTHDLLGEHDEARKAQERVLRLARELGERSMVARTLGRLGSIKLKEDRFFDALADLRAALDLQGEIGDRRSEAAILGNMGAVRAALGDHARSLARHEEALGIFRELGDGPDLVSGLHHVALAHRDLGDCARALSFLEEARDVAVRIGRDEHRARVLADLANLNIRLGRLDRALTLHLAALDIFESRRDRRAMAGQLVNLGRVREKQRLYEEALAPLDRARQEFERLEDRSGLAVALAALGTVHGRLGHHEEALDLLDRALEQFRGLGEMGQVASVRSIQARVLYEKGDPAGALRTWKKALSEADEIGRADMQVMNAYGMAQCELALERPRAALTAARNAVRGLTRLTGRLSESTVTGMRTGYSVVHDIGIMAAAALGDVDEALFFFESGRAGTLLESLEFRAGIQAALLPRHLLDAEIAARAEEASALRVFRQASTKGQQDAVREARTALDRAREKAAEVHDRIRREAKAAASVLSPGPAALRDIRMALRPAQALVLFGLCREKSGRFDDTCALVVRKRGARLVSLGPTGPVLEACSALKLESDAFDPAPAIARLRKLLLEPLGLDRSVTRLLVSPDGALSYVPFAALAESREIVHVSSATTWLLLREDRDARGEGVLAMGHPDYGTKPDPSAAVVQRSGDWLRPLPRTEEEARTVGTTVLVGKAATEAALRAAGSRRRWRAVHLACHGFVDAARPMLSSLALTPAGEDDGFLTVMDVFRMKLPADLAVLSACRTGRGQIVRGEGVLGLTRAFMFAGAPRVIVSLWKVDDEATRALMVRFYELWTPGTLSTAAALRRAQEHVRGQNRWRHPYYWAAWQLWGLGD